MTTNELRKLFEDNKDNLTTEQQCAIECKFTDVRIHTNYMLKQNDLATVNSVRKDITNLKNEVIELITA